MLDPKRIRAITNQHGKVILALDGIQPDVGHEVLWVVRDCLSGEILFARSLLSSTQDDLAALLSEVRTVLEVPIEAVLSDGQQSIRKAVAQALPGVPHQLCQFHYLRAITVVLDNARYQKWALVQAHADALEIELLYLPSYSPHPNLIERLWRFVRKECLYSRYYATFARGARCIAFWPKLTRCASGVTRHADGSTPSPSCWRLRPTSCGAGTSPS